MLVLEIRGGQFYDRGISAKFNSNEIDLGKTTNKTINIFHVKPSSSLAEKILLNLWT